MPPTSTNDPKNNPLISTPSRTLSQQHSTTPYRLKHNEPKPSICLFSDFCQHNHLFFALAMRAPMHPGSYPARHTQKAMVVFLESGGLYSCRLPGGRNPRMGNFPFRGQNRLFFFLEELLPARKLDRTYRHSPEKKLLVIAFRGSQKLQDWCNNFSVFLKKYDTISPDQWMHKGYTDIFMHCGEVFTTTLERVMAQTGSR